MVIHRNFPTFIGTMLGYDCHLSFSLPYALAQSTIACLFLLFVSFFKLVIAQEFCANARIAAFHLIDGTGFPLLDNISEFLKRAFNPIILDLSWHNNGLVRHFDTINLLNVSSYSLCDYMIPIFIWMTVKITRV